MRVLGDRFSIQEDWRGSADKVASEIARARGAASAGGTVRLAEVSRAAREKIMARLKSYLAPSRNGLPDCESVTSVL